MITFFYILSKLIFVIQFTFSRQYMNLRFISLTGADDKTNIKDLEILSSKYPLFECAVLIFPESRISDRNPTAGWRKYLYKSSVKNKAVHLCGTSINDFAQQKSIIMQDIEKVQRVQINLHARWASEKLYEQLVKVVQRNPQIEFITQHNEQNKPYFHYWGNVANHSFLFDSSLGKGICPNRWNSPVKNKSCGYAGGLEPDNIVENLCKIFSVVNDELFWIDMESGIRTDNKFDLQKCEDVLQVSTDWYKNII